MERLLLECSIRAALVAIGTGAILSLMRVRTAAARHAVWAGVVMFMLVLPVWTVWGPKTELRVLPAPATVTRAPIAMRPEASAAPMTDAVVNPSPTSTPPPRGFSWSWWDLVWVIYAAGTLWLLTRLAIGTIRSKYLTGADCVAPVTVGLFRPRVILPQGWSEWTRGQLDVILAHEHAHVRRRDPLVQWLALLNRALFWFHPLAWWLERRLAALAEEACDAAVLECGHDAAEYAECLLDIERSVKQAGARVPVLGMAMPGSGLPRRIRLIFDGPRWPRISRTKMFCAAAACSATAAVLCAGTLERMPELRLPPIQPAVHTLLAPKSDGVLLAQAQTPPVQPAATAASPQAKPKFDVASVRPCQPGDGAGREGRGGGSGGRSFGDSPGKLWVTCFSLREMMDIAYRQFDSHPLLNDRGTPMAAGRIRGGPGWINSAYYTVNAETDNPIANGPTGGRSPASMMLNGQMLQSLLEDRFQAMLHRGTEEVPMYALTVAKGGLKLKHTEEGGCIRHEPGTPLMVSEMFPAGQKPLCVSHLAWDGPNWTIDAAGQNLATLAGTLSDTMDRHVIDTTGNTDVFTYHLVFAHDDDAPGSFPEGFPSPFVTTDDPPGASVFTALGEVGLRLEPIKGPREFIVIDHVERPSEN